MKVPISSTRFAPVPKTSSSRKRPSTGPVSICGALIVAFVSSASAASSGTGAVVCRSAYSSIFSSTRKLIARPVEPPTIASRPSAKRTIALPLPS